jgi:hypothetical protein
MRLALGLGLGFGGGLRERRVNYYDFRQGPRPYFFLTEKATQLPLPEPRVRLYKTFMMPYTKNPSAATNKGRGVS